MKQYWNDLIKSSKITLNLKVPSYDIYDEVIELYYTQENRHYHNLEHIQDMMNHLNNDFFQYISLREYCLIGFSIFFHDIIYDPKRVDNEILSALLAHRHLRNMNVPYNFSKIVHDAILKTQYFTNKVPESYIEMILVDLDLRGLGTEQYWENEQKIRKEFPYISDEDWNEGRKKFLKKFLKYNYIYQTNLYRMKYNKKAKEYIEKELQSL